jgi:hypothetical protein
MPVTIGMVITGILALLAGQFTLKGVVSLPALPVGLVV